MFTSRNFLYIPNYLLTKCLVNKLTSDNRLFCKQIDKFAEWHIDIPDITSRPCCQSCHAKKVVFQYLSITLPTSICCGKACNFHFISFKTMKNIVLSLLRPCRKVQKSLWNIGKYIYFFILLGSELNVKGNKGLKLGH